MATKLRQLSNKSKKINLIKIVLEVVRETTEGLIVLNQGQLQDNKDSSNKSLGKYKSKSYARRKGRTTVDLKLEGDFYKGFFVKADKFPIIFGSKDSKTFFLKGRYGDKIFGLTKENLRLYNTHILLPRVRAKIAALLQL